MTSVEDAAWRRPSGDDQQAGTDDAAGGQPAPAAAGSPRYTGPPRNTPPQPGWRPEFVVEPAPPRTLPAQDHSWIDVREAAARTVTYGVGLAAGAIMLVVMFVLCGRAWY